jgi:Lrp/AsnC family transcriptional regulator for asnA, asnC and gidA
VSKGSGEGVPDPSSSRISRRPSGGLDDVDRALVARLQQDGREGNRSLAAALGANEVTIANRLKRLEDAGIMRVVAVVDMAAFGRTELVLLLIRAVGRPVADVAKDIAELDDVSAVTITTGRFDIVVTLLARDHQHIGEMLAGELAQIDGIDLMRKELALEVQKYESKWAQLDPHADLALKLEPHGSLDELDIAIVEKLQADARQSNRRIAADLGVVEGTVRLRLKRMQDENAIRIQALSDVAAFGVGAHAYVGLEVHAEHLADVSAALRSLPQVAVLIRSLGEFDYIAVVHAEDRRQLLEVVLSQIAATPGVRHTETMESFMTLKHTATWVRILD